MTDTRVTIFNKLTELRIGPYYCNYTGMDKTSLGTSSGSLFVRMSQDVSGCPRDVERNYVQLFGVSQSNADLRYYVSRITSDCYLNIVVPLDCITVLPPSLPPSLTHFLPPSLPPSFPPSLPPSPPLPPSLPPLPLVTQQIHCPFQPKQSPSYLPITVSIFVWLHTRFFQYRTAVKVGAHWTAVKS